MPTKNWEVFAKDPRSSTIPNDGVTEVGLPTTDKEWDVLRYELSTFVCEGEYERGLERILNTYLANLDQSVQPAVWVSGFYGSGKSPPGARARVPLARCHLPRRRHRTQPCNSFRTPSESCSIELGNKGKRPAGSGPPPAPSAPAPATAFGSPS